jgi:hypothetical protein
MAADSGRRYDSWNSRPYLVEHLMRRSVLSLTLIAVSPVLADEPAPRVENLLPLAVGNSWTYRVSGQDDRFIVRVVRQEMVGEQTCFRLDATLKDRVVASEHLAFTKDGLCRFKVDSGEVKPPVCILKLPVPKGSRWQQRYQVGERGATGFFSVNTSEVNVPLGKFKAVIVDATTSEGPGRPSTRTVVSYADGVGIVKQEIIDGKRTLTLELEKFGKEEEK